jgi:hypothetical protein
MEKSSLETVFFGTSPLRDAGLSSRLGQYVRNLDDRLVRRVRGSEGESTAGGEVWKVSKALLSQEEDRCVHI